MSKFLDKKQTVFDLKLTSYGKRQLANGKFKPEYYTFLDDNVIYDSQYAGFTEHQNGVHERIKKGTQYLEGLVDFRPSVNDKTRKYRPFQSREERRISSESIIPGTENHYYEKIIGNAHHSADIQLAPAMKIVTLVGEISSSTDKDLKNKFNIPQLNIESYYQLKATPYEPYYDSEQEQKLNKLVNSTLKFADNQIISLIASDIMIYAEEINTDILNENFDIEVFEVSENTIPPIRPGGNKIDELKRKYFKKDFGKIQGGYMSPDETNITNKFYVDEIARQQLSNQSVAKYFDVLLDYEVDKNDACKASSVFNKESYYVDIDFDCEHIIDEQIGSYDIYGVVTEPEIC
jgi:hypothetical protein